MSHRLTPANTLHPHEMSRKATWHTPNGQVPNQIDFILTRQRFKSSINKANTRSFPVADIESDHDLELTTIKLKLKTKCFTKSPRIRFDLEKLKDPKIAEVFQAKVGGKFAARANSLKERLLSTAKAVPWETEEEVSTLGHKQGSGSVRPEMAAETIEVHMR